MCWNKIKDKYPPKKTWLVVWRDERQVYIICKYDQNEWKAQSNWYHKVGPDDEWMVLPTRR